MHVLITGATGFVAAHIIQHLLRHSHTVVGTVRSSSSARTQALHNFFGSEIVQKRLALAVVPDMAAPGAFDDTLSNFGPFDAVMHTASPASWFGINDIQTELIDPAINGTLSVLKSVSSHGSTVKRVVMTSSQAAMGDGEKGYWPGHTYDEQDWNPLTKEQALTDAFLGYCFGKTEAERQAWKYVELKKPHFTLTTLPAPVVLGPNVMPPVGGAADLPLGVQMVYHALQGAWKDSVSETTFPAWIDARDLAEAHVRAIEREAAGGLRIWPVSDEYSSNRDLADVIKSEFPEYNAVISAEGGALPPDVYKIGNGRARDVLGMEYRPFSTMIVDLVKNLKTIKA